jgi:hypothetical protein
MQNNSLKMQGQTCIFKKTFTYVPKKFEHLKNWARFLI